MNQILTDDHYSLKINNDIRDICNPLFAHGIKHFCYARYYNDGTCYALVSEKELYQHHMNNEFLFSPNVNEKFLQKRFHYIVMPELEDGFSQAAYDYKNYFDISLPIYMFERYENYMDLYVFATQEGNGKSVNHFLSNIDFLENYKFYFKEKASKLIENCNKNRLVLPLHMRPGFCGVENADPKSHIPVELLPKRYFLAGRHEGLHLTQRQVEILKLFSRGYTSKETAKIIDISPRTVEFYVDELKLKFKMKKKRELIRVIQETGLI